MTFTHVHPAQLLGGDAVHELCIIDVRTAAEVKSEPMDGSIHIPLHELTPERLQDELHRHGQTGRPLYLLSQTGSRAQQAAQRIYPHDNEIYVIHGGVDALRQSRLPLEQGVKGTISMERQNSVALGTLILLSVLLGLGLHPAWFGLAALIGMAQIAGGIVDICPMCTLLSRMPWNR